GWSAPIYMNDGEMWKVKREVPNWERCQDGTAFPGQQTFFFYPVNENGGYQLGSRVFSGKDKTVGPSGACGQNQWLDIAMPLRVDQLSWTGDRRFSAPAAAWTKDTTQRWI